MKSKNDLFIGLFVALVLHLGLAFGGDFFKGKPPRAVVDSSIPIIELAPLPPADPEPPAIQEPSAEGGGDISDIVPPMQADTASPTASAFTQQVQPPPPPSINRNTTKIALPGRPGSGIGTGNGQGFKNLFDLASLDQPLTIRVRATPVYPHEMSRAGINGIATVGFVVDAEGNVRDPYIVSSSQREFEAEALRAALRFKFKPPRKNGVNVSTRATLPFTFNISN